MHQTWTDEHGLAHYVQHGRTFCGVLVCPTTAHAIDGCGDCVRVSIDDYARRLAEREGLGTCSVWPTPPPHRPLSSTN